MYVRARARTHAADTDLHAHTRIHVHERAPTPLLDLGRIELGSRGKCEDGCPEERGHGLEACIYAQIYTSAYIVNINKLTDVNLYLVEVYRRTFVRVGIITHRR